MGASDNIVLEMSNLSKSYGEVKAVDDVSLSVRENEFFALLGPSGCGKTTLMRLIAGFERPSAGQILLDGQDLSPVPPNHRPLNLMFQSYALFDHMSVRGNVSYGLEMEKLPNSEINERVDQILEVTGLTGFMNRKPAQLSGGQRQRVALARAVVKRPRVLLLDEPLAALDKKLRESMQLELKRLQHEIGITFIVVTHDQEEALVMADRVAVLNDGSLKQEGPPTEVYEHPKDRFVAQFIGVMNFFDGTATVDGVQIKPDLKLSGDVPAGIRPGETVTLAVRPERLSLHTQEPDNVDNHLQGEVVGIAYHGLDVTLSIEVRGCDGVVLIRIPANENDKLDLKEGGHVHIAWDARHSRILPE